MDRVCSWGNQFIKTRHFEKLTEEQKDCAESVVLSFTEHMYTDYGLSAENWNVSALKKCCLHRLPEMFVTGESYFASMAPVLSSFFEFLSERKLVKRASVLAEKITEIEEQIVANALNPENWNIGKTIAMAAVDAGVDITSEEEMSKFCQTIIEEPLADSLKEKVLEDNMSSHGTPNTVSDRDTKGRKKKKRTIEQTSLYEWTK